MIPLAGKTMTQRAGCVSILRVSRRTHYASSANDNRVAYVSLLSYCLNK
jgi:hypothetical protein